MVYLGGLPSYKNLSEVIREILGHCRAEIRLGEDSTLQSEMAEEEHTRPLPTATTWQQRTPDHVKKAHLAHQASRDDRYQQMTTLRAQGVTQREVATRMGMSERAVRSWLKRGAAPTNERHMRRRSAFDPYAPYVLQRWQAGVHDATRLYEEIRARGFSGTVRIVQRFVQALRDDPEKIALAPATGADRFSSNTATWLFLRDREKLTAEKQAELELICQRSETARLTYELTQQFMMMLRQRRGQEFEMWLSAVEASPLPELHRFAQGQERRCRGTYPLCQQWASRGSGSEAQIGQALDVWSCQTPSVTATPAPCGLISTALFVRKRSFFTGDSSFSSRCVFSATKLTPLSCPRVR